MRIAFVDPIDWDYCPETPYQKPLGGSQSALCYLAEALAKQGHEVFLLNGTTRSHISRGVMCLPLSVASSALMQSFALDALIILNSVTLGRQIKPLLSANTRLVCWLQSAADQQNVLPLHQPAEHAVFDGIALVSDWQSQQFQHHFGLDKARIGILRNAIAPTFHQLFLNNTSILKAKQQPPILAYTSTPFRGLNLLLEAFPAILQAVPGTRLKVFSSMKVYQQNEAEDAFRALYQRCRELEGVEYIGSLPQPELAQELRTVTALTYPNTFFETSCISVMEAIACGCQVITSDLGALPETTAGFAKLIPIENVDLTPKRFVAFTEASRQSYLRRFVDVTIQVLQTPIEYQEVQLREQVDYVNRACTWPVQAQEWVTWLSHLSDRHALQKQSQPVLDNAAQAEDSRREIRQEELQTKVATIASPQTKGSHEAALEQIAQLGQSGRFAEAIALCHQILHVDPNQAHVWNLLGLATFQSGKLEESVEYLQKAIALSPNTADFHSHLGVVYCKLDQWVKGIECYRRALNLHPQSVDIQYNLALALHKHGDDEAIAHYQQVLSRQPNHAQSHLNLGNLLQQQGQFTQAIAHYRQALSTRPAHAETWLRLGSAHQSQAELEEAVRCYQQALTLNPAFVDAHNNLGTVLHELGRAQQAIAHYQQALTLKPNFSYALINLGNIFLKLERFTEAEAAYRQLLQHEPENLKALDGLVKLLRQTCQWADVEKLSAQLMTIAQRQLDQGLPCPVMPLNTLLLPFSPAQQQAIAREQANAIAERMSESCRQLNFSAQFQERMSQPRERLRLGYVSGDFRDHAVAHLMLQLFGLHDRRQFEVYAYSLGPDDGSTYRQRLMHDCDRFVDSYRMTPTAIAQHIFKDGIDILIDLAGYTEYNSAEVFALRPAPIQVNYLGYPGTLGADYIDYILTDAVITPPEQTTYFTERCVYLPYCYQINDNQQQLSPEIPSKSTLGLPEQSFVYCCFNNTRKIDPQLFAVWMQILKQVPDSVLWLYQSYPEAEHNLRREAEQSGVGGDRLIFAQRLPKANHLARLQHADLFLDTRYYNAHTTASDALWSGVPLVTLSGDTFASRVAASLLTAIGLPQLITHNLKDYEQLATRLGQHPQDLDQLKQTLATNRLTMPLYDTEQSVRSLEKAYQSIWMQFESRQQG